MNSDLSEYRNHLVLAKQKAHEDFDKTVLALSGGGLGLSLTFIDKIVGPRPICAGWAIFVAWIVWALSLAFVLASYFLSIRALGKAVDQVDGGQAYRGQIGGLSTRLTESANLAGAVLFFLGAGFMITFVSINLGR